MLMVASSGGHLTQLLELSERLRPQREQIWVSFDGDHARSVLEGRQAEFIPYIPPRGYRQLVMALPRAARIMRRHRPEVVVSTGSGIALAFLPSARLWGAKAHYIESATRSDGPSHTGKVLARFHRIRLHTQHPSWADDQWSYDGSVFEGYEAVEIPRREITKVVVTLGTMETFGFRRLVERLREILPPDADVLWQTGATDTSGLNIDARRMIPSHEIHAAIEAADVVVGHSGTGIALTCLSLGVRPVLVPRSSSHGEHIDDHQAQTAAFLQGRGIAATHKVHQLDFEDLAAATAWKIEPRRDRPPYNLST